MFCIKCGKELPDNAKFCPFCGANNEKNQLEIQEQSHSEKKNKGKKSHLILIWLLILGLIIGVYVYRL